MVNISGKITVSGEINGKILHMGKDIFYSKLFYVINTFYNNQLCTVETNKPNSIQSVFNFAITTIFKSTRKLNLSSRAIFKSILLMIEGFIINGESDM